MIDLITGHQGMAHITAEQISDINNAMMDGYGVDKVMRLDGGDVTLDGLSLVIEVGYWRVNGFDMEIKEEETLYFDPTVAGVSRIDDVYVEILQDITDGYQRAVLVIVQGEPDVSPVAPDEPTTPELNTDILLQIVHVARCTISSGAMTVSDKTIVYKYVSPEDLTSITIKGSTNNTGSTITSGTYFYLNGDLVKAKTSIANGATLTLNTNYEIPTAGALNALQSSISTLNSALSDKLNKSDVVNNLSTTTTNVPLSAAMGKYLNDNKQATLTYGTLSQLTVGTYLKGFIIRIGKLRYIHLYDGEGDQAAGTFSNALSTSDIPGSSFTLWTWALTGTNEYGSRSLSFTQNSRNLVLNGKVSRGGFSGVYYTA